MLAVLAATPMSASAAPVSGTSARFAVSISGKFTSSGRATRSCRDANDNPIVAHDVAATTWTFASTRTGRAEFDYLGSDLLAGMTRLITVAATGARSASESPTCAPQTSSQEPVGTGCGTKTKRYLMSIYAKGKPARVGYGINKDLNHLDWPDDPWGSAYGPCPGLAQGWTTLTVYSAPPTPISLARIFNKRVSRFVANGTRTGHAMDVDSSSAWTLHYKITLTRRR